MGGVEVDGLLGVERCGSGGRGRGVQISLVARNSIPRASVVVRHEVPEVQALVHTRHIVLVKVIRAGGARNAQQEFLGVLLDGGGVAVEASPQGGEEVDVGLGLSGVCGVFPVDVEAVEAEVFEELDGAVGEGLDLLGGVCGGGEVGGVGPAADGEEDVEVGVGLFEEVELLHAAVDVGADIVPGVGGVVLFEVGVGVGEVAV